MLTQPPMAITLLLAQEAGGRGYTVSWAVVLLAAILAIVVALRPAKRDAEIRKPHDV